MDIKVDPVVETEPLGFTCDPNTGVLAIDGWNTLAVLDEYTETFVAFTRKTCDELKERLSTINPEKYNVLSSNYSEDSAGRGLEVAIVLDQDKKYGLLITRVIDNPDGIRHSVTNSFTGISLARAIAGYTSIIFNGLVGADQIIQTYIADQKP